MKNVLTSVVLLLAGALLYHFLKPVFTKEKAYDQVVWGPHVYLNALDQQEAGNLSSLNTAVDSVVQKLAAPKANAAALSATLKEVNDGSRVTRRRLEEIRKQWESRYAALLPETSLLVNPPKPPPPPPPCKGIGCHELDLDKKKLILVYHPYPVIVKITSINGRELGSSVPGTASQTVISDKTTKIVLDLSASDFTGEAVLSIEGERDGLAQINATIR